MRFTTITNGEGDAMRQLERKEAAPAAKTPAKTTKAAKAETGSKSSAKDGEAQLLLANGEMSEAARVGMLLVGGGITALTLGMLEGLARKGKMNWWRDLGPAKRGVILSAFALAAGLIARHRRNNGHHQSANALEAAGIGAWTMAVVYFTEAGLDDAEEVAGFADGETEGIGFDRLKALDAQIDQDIRDAAQRLRELAEKDRAAAERRARDSERDIGLLAFHGEHAVEEDEDDDEDLF